MTTIERNHRLLGFLPNAVLLFATWLATHVTSIRRTHHSRGLDSHFTDLLTQLVLVTWRRRNNEKSIPQHCTRRLSLNFKFRRRLPLLSSGAFVVLSGRISWPIALVEHYLKTGLHRQQTFEIPRCVQCPDSLVVVLMKHSVSIDRLWRPCMKERESLKSFVVVFHCEAGPTTLLGVISIGQTFTSKEKGTTITPTTPYILISTLVVLYLVDTISFFSFASFRRL